MMLIAKVHGVLVQVEIWNNLRTVTETRIGLSELIIGIHCPRSIYERPANWKEIGRSTCSKVNNSLLSLSRPRT